MTASAPFPHASSVRGSETGSTAFRTRLKVSRRKFIQASALGTAALGTGAHAFSNVGGGGPDHRSSRNIVFLLDRITQGFTLPEYYEAIKRGYSETLESQLSPETIDDSDLDAVLAGLPTLALSYRELYVHYGRIPELQETPFYELKGATMIRALYSKRQLLERMVEFWSNHFNIDHQEEVNLWFKTVDDRDVIRQHALGKFPDMLRASARSGAMLYYLDNYTNVAGAPNENYARELLELHTLGADGPYQEFDVKNVARALTGWTIKTLPFVDVGEFFFDASSHDNEQKLILGEIFPPGGGIEDGNRVLDILAQHPKTADFISRKMCRWLLSENPPESIVQRTAQTYLATGGDIKSMIRVILDPANLQTTSPDSLIKFKRPMHMTHSLLRATGTSTNDLGPYYFTLAAMGQAPLGWPAPDGYPDSIADWGSNLLPRWSFAADLAQDTFPGLEFDLQYVDTILGGIDPPIYHDQINWLLTGGRMTAEETARIRAFIDDQPFFTESVARQAIGLAAASPSFQSY